MPAVNMQDWYTANKDKLLELKEAFVDAMENDEDFLDSAQSSFEGNKINPNHGLAFKYSKAITLEPIDELIGALEIANFVLPAQPPEMSTDNIERYKTHVFDDTRLDLFESKLKSVYGSFTTPSAFQFNNEDLKTAIQTAFYDYKYDRDKEALIHRIDEAANSWAADGYLVAPGAFSYNVAQDLNDFDRQRYTGTEGVFKDLAQVVQSNIQSSLQDGTQIEELHMDFAIKYSELSKVFIQSAVDAYVAELEKRLAEQRAQIEKIDYLTRSLGLDHKADVTKNKLELDERTKRLSAYISATNAHIATSAEVIHHQLKLAENIAEGYGAIFTSYGSQFTGVSYEEA